MNQYFTTFDEKKNTTKFRKYLCIYRTEKGKRNNKNGRMTFFSRFTGKAKFYNGN